jgi:hypothetical protein
VAGQPKGNLVTKAKLNFDHPGQRPKTEWFQGGSKGNGLGIGKCEEGARGKEVLRASETGSNSRPAQYYHKYIYICTVCMTSCNVSYILVQF